MYKKSNYKKKYTKHKKFFRKKRKGLNKWTKGVLATLLPSAIAVGIGAVKHLLKKNTGYQDIYA